MKKICFAILAGTLLFTLDSCQPQENKETIPAEVTMTKDTLLDKIKGGWAGQTIGCTYGGPTEFRYSGTMIADYIPIDWPDGYIKWYYDNSPGLYDDVYMDLTFVDVFDRLGLDAPVDSFAMAFAKAGYPLWHANQAARYNILQGLKAPESGHWRNNPHADDIDFQIEADFAGLMAPGMPATASKISDGIGHIMNYGDGWYGGVYVANMYALAFVCNDVEFIVEEALKSIPAESKFYKVMADVIKWHKEYPDDWKQCWAEVEKIYDDDKSCPGGIFQPFNIDATVNSAYIIIGLLYGEGDFYKTLDISTRCGQDSDCNPASAGGILGTMLGYSNIPEYWMKNLKEVEDIDFAHTTISLNKVYQLGLNQALQVVERNGGTVDGDNVTIKTQTPETVRFEQSFPDIHPVKKISFWGDQYRRGGGKTIDNVGPIEFDGTGIVVDGGVRSSNEDYVAEVEAYIDGEAVETINLPASNHSRRHELFWKYELPKKEHTLEFKWLNPNKDASVTISSYIVFSDAPAVNNHQ